MSTALFLTIRVLHVLFAALWIGAAAFTTLLLMPTIEQTGPAGGQIMVGLNRRGFVPYMASLGGLTVLSGLWLFWRFTGGFDPEISGSPAGIMFSAGGTAGIVAMLIGTIVIGRSAKKVLTIMAQAGPMGEGPERLGLMQQAAALRQRMSLAGKIVLALQVIALAMMAIGHYV